MDISARLHTALYCFVMAYNVLLHAVNKDHNLSCRVYSFFTSIRSWLGISCFSMLSLLLRENLIWQHHLGSFLYFCDYCNIYVSAFLHLQGGDIKRVHYEDARL